MNDVKVSIIIPVYNVENYLRQCLDSIVDQTLKQIEIICVNDGSTDNSLQILEEYAKQDERIKIINQKNMGPAAARKIGLNNAHGEFIAFVDSDDWIKLDACEKLYKNAVSNNSDVVLLNFILYDESTEKYTHWKGLNIAAQFDKNTDFNNFIFDHSDIKPILLNGFTGCTNKLYKTKFLKSYDDFYFPKSISLGEDVPLNVQVLLRAQRMSLCKENFYIYRTSNINSNSNTTTKNKQIFTIFTIIDEVENILIENRIMIEYKNEFSMFQIVHLTHWLNRCDKLHIKEFFDLMKQYFSKMDLKDHDINRFNSSIKNNYQYIMGSETYKEFELKLKRDLIESTHNKRLEIQKQDYEKKLEILKLNYEKNLDIKELTIKQMNSSNSWKLTKPLRKVGTGIKRLKKIK